jgi:PIN domain nuclease of toxin-antitoxin system
VKALLDTQCWLWWLADPDLLNREAHRAIADQRNALFLSAASSWEIAIKVGLGKLRLPQPPDKYVPQRLADQGMSPLPIEHAHALNVANLPPHHRDPFDRLLVSQAQLERLALLTADPQLLAYDVAVIWAGWERPPSRRPPRPRR